MRRFLHPVPPSFSNKVILKYTQRSYRNYHNYLCKSEAKYSEPTLTGLSWCLVGLVSCHWGTLQNGPEHSGSCFELVMKFSINKENSCILIAVPVYIVRITNNLEKLILVMLVMWVWWMHYEWYAENALYLQGWTTFIMILVNKKWKRMNSLEKMKKEVPWQLIFTVDFFPSFQTHNQLDYFLKVLRNIR